jgi:hypothetical protein
MHPKIAATLLIHLINTIGRSDKVTQFLIMESNPYRHGILLLDFHRNEVFNTLNILEVGGKENVTRLILKLSLRYQCATCKRKEMLRGNVVTAIFELLK